MPARWGAPLAAQLQPLANRQRRLGAVQSIKVDGRRAALDRLAAQLGDDIGAEFADRIDIVAERFQTLGDPARNLGAAHVGETAQLRILRDRHDARRDRHADAELARVVDEAEIRIGVEEVLRDRTIRAGVDLALEVGQIAHRIAGLRMHFGIAGDIDMKLAVAFPADEFDLIPRVAEVSIARHARTTVAEQLDDAFATHGLVLIEQLGDLRARTAHAR